MRREYSAAARRKLTEPWEERVLWVYDDKRKKTRNPSTGKLEYPEWDGGEVRGTLTIGIGHTDAAGPIMIEGLPEKITQGLRINFEQADQILDRDLEPCVRKVNEILKVEVTQHQFDGLVDTYFNCPKAAIAAISLINAGRAKDVPTKLLQYTFSKGEHMEGLTHRRMSEINWMHTPDEAKTPEPPDSDTVNCPKGERNPPPKSWWESKVIHAGGAIAAGGGGLITSTLQKAHEAAEPIKDLKQDISDLGIPDLLSSLLHSQVALAVFGGILGALGLFVIGDRLAKLWNEHV